MVYNDGRGTGLDEPLLLQPEPLGEAHPTRPVLKRAEAQRAKAGNLYSMVTDFARFASIEWLSPRKRGRTWTDDRSDLLSLFPR